MKVDTVQAHSISGNSTSSSAAANTVVSRDGSSDIHANKFHSQHLSLTHTTASRTGDTVFYSSDGNTVYKNTDAGFRESVGLKNVNNIAATTAATPDRIVLRDADGDIFAAGVESDKVVISNVSGGELFRYTDGTRTVYGGCDANHPWFGTSSAHKLRLVTNGSDRITLDTGGNVGIGTNSPKALTHIGKFSENSGTHNTIPSAGAGVSADFPDSTHLWLGNHSAAETEDYWGMALGTLYTGGNSYIQTLSKYPNNPLVYYNLLLQPNGGNVGIGLSNPGNTLDVRGGLAVSFDDNSRMAIDSGGTVRRHYLSGGTNYGAGLHFTLDAIFPTDYAGSYVNNQIDLGTSSHRWKGVYTEYLNVHGSSMFTNTVNIVNNDTNAYAHLEMGGTNGAYIDLKSPNSDDYDLRFITTGSGGSIQVAGGSEGMTFLSDGKIGIGETSPSYKLHVAGDIYATGNITAYSDRRAKSNIEKIENPLEKINKISGYTYTMKTEDNSDKRYTGLIAQEVLEILPEAVMGSEESQYSLAYGNMVGILVEAIKELKMEIDELKRSK